MKADNNILVRHNSGMIDNLIIRERFGKTVAYRKPVSKTGWAPTPGQKVNRNNFKIAHEFAMSVKDDPVLHEFYKARVKPGLGPYHIAVRDARKPPVIKELDISEYKGRVNDPIMIVAMDDTLVTEVHVAVFAFDGALVEEGLATSTGRLEEWKYDSRLINDRLKGGIIRAIARDMPGNEAILETAVIVP